MNHIIAIVQLGIAYAFFTVLLDSFMKTDKEKLSIIYKLIIVILLITTIEFAKDHNMVSVLIALLSLTFIEKMKQVKE